MGNNFHTDFFGKIVVKIFIVSEGLYNKDDSQSCLLILICNTVRITLTLSFSNLSSLSCSHDNNCLLLK